MSSSRSLTSANNRLFAPPVGFVLVLALAIFSCTASAQTSAQDSLSDRLLRQDVLLQASSSSSSPVGVDSLVNTPSTIAASGRALLSTPCRRRRSAAWLATHPRKTGPKEVHHDRPRLPWCDEVDDNVVVVAAAKVLSASVPDTCPKSGLYSVTLTVNSGTVTNIVWTEHSVDDCDTIGFQLKAHPTNLVGPEFYCSTGKFVCAKVTFDTEEVLKKSIAATPSSNSK